ncbi:glycosyltransferase [Desulfovibrio sp. MES5]|uniref:glycosyltransferase n=1 Tax=Desulfovibrio sp. MES5 TaxID=1899016 RepID=UPI0025C4BC50|nr:glycosyltransferase [Desulfovibrio sp. MES5]
MQQRIVFYSGHMWPVWQNTFFANNHDTLNKAGVALMGERDLNTFSNVRDYLLATDDPAKLAEEMQSLLTGPAQTVLVPAYEYIFQPQKLQSLLYLTRKKNPSAEIILCHEMANLAYTFLYELSICYTMHFYPQMYDDIIEHQINCIKGKTTSYRHFLQRLSTGSINFFNNIDVFPVYSSPAGMEEGVKHLLRLAGLDEELFTTFDFTPPLMGAPLADKTRAWIYTLKQLFRRFGAAFSSWDHEQRLLNADGERTVPFNEESLVKLYEVYAEDKKLFPDFPVWGDYAQNFRLKKRRALPALVPDDAAQMLTLHSQGCSTILTEYFSKLTPRYLTVEERELLAPWLKGSAYPISSPVSGSKKQENEFTYIGGTQTTQAKVAVITATYNHVQYIRECIESVLAQNAPFPIEHIIADDGSTDGTAEIIRDYAARYPHIIPILHNPHAGGAINHEDLYTMTRSPYVAVCEGDDYFSDTTKLRTQAEFLDKNKDMALCFHPVRVAYENNQYEDRFYPPSSMFPTGPDFCYDLEDLLRGNMIQTNAVMYRWRFTNGLPEWFQCGLLPGDWYLHLLHAEKGKIGFIDKVMSVYRRHGQGTYWSAEVDRLEHRAATGMKELEVYDVVNKHFNRRYESILLDLVNGVFVDCLLYDSERGQDEEPILNTLTDKHPHFARHFLDSLKNLSSPKES